MLNSSSPWPCTTQARSAPSAPSTRASGSSHLGSNTPSTWRLAPGRVGQRPQQVEDGAEPQFLAHGRHVAHRGVVGRREQEADVGLVQRRRLCSRSASMLTPSAASTSEEPDLDDMRPGAVLGDLHPAAGGDKRRGGGDVQRVASVAARAAGVHHVVGELQLQRRRAQGPRAGGDLLHRLAAHPHGGDRRGDLGRRRLAPQAGGEEGLGVCLAQGLAVGERGEQRFEVVGHGPGQTAARRFTPARSRKLASSSWPYSVAMDFGVELHPVHGPALVPQAHDLAVVGPGGDLQHVRQGFALDRQAVVARGGEGVRDALEHALAVVMDRAGLAVHQGLGADHLAADRPGRWPGGPGRRPGSAGSPARARSNDRQMPASFGVQGPGDRMHRFGRPAPGRPDAESSSLRWTSVSAPSSFT